MSAKTSKPARLVYSDAQKYEVVTFVKEHNAAHGKGGQNEAARKFGVSPLSITAWLKQDIPVPLYAQAKPAAGAVVVTTEQPRRPEWDAVRETVDQVKFHGRMFLRGQVKLGMLLAGLKKDHCKHGGDRQKQVPDSGTCLSWKDLVQEETGYSRQSCDEFIKLFDATTAKLKKGKKLELPAAAKKSALVLFQSENPLILTPEQWTVVDDVIASLTTGETQASLMQEFGLVAKPAKMPKKKPGTEEEETEEETAGQLAFIFFGTVASPLINARTNPDYKKMLLALPVHSDSEHPLSLSTLEAEFRAALADVEDAKQAHAKPARGKIIDA